MITAQDGVHRGQVSRVRQEFVGLSSGDSGDVDRASEPPATGSILREIPQGVMQFEPESPLHLDLSSQSASAVHHQVQQKC